MNTKRSRGITVTVVVIAMAVASTRLNADSTSTCGGQITTIPFNDVTGANVFFCSVAEAYFSGLTNGTSATTYSPSDPVLREQMAAFVSRTMDQSLKRGSKRAALNQYWTTQGAGNLAFTAVGNGPNLLQSDGADIWVASNTANSVSRVRASDGTRIGSDWTGATAALGVLCAMGKVFITGNTTPGNLYRIDPTQPPGLVTTLSTALGEFPRGIAYDGQRLWTANAGPQSGSVSIITLNPTTVTNVATGFNSVNGIIFDGTNIWVTDDIPGPVDKLRKLDPTGAILLSVDVDALPQFPAFDGSNIWVPSFFNHTVKVVRVKDPQGNSVVTPVILATLSGNGLNEPVSAAFDGQRILVTNFGGDSVSLWKASDLTALGTFSTTTGGSTVPWGACSDGLNFWIALSASGQLARF